MSLTLFDAIVVVVVLISALLAMVRGFVREVLSVASWVIAALAAYFLYDKVAPLIETTVGEQASVIIAAAVIFFVVLIIATYITIKIADFVIDSRVGAVDRLLGLLFGGARGVLLLVIAFFFFTWLVPLAEQPTWIANAESRPILQDLGEKLITVLPDDVEATLLDRLHGEDDTGNAPATDAPPPGTTTSPDPFGSLFDPATEQSPDYDRNSLDQLFTTTDPAPAPTTTNPAPAPAR